MKKAPVIQLKVSDVSEFSAEENLKKHELSSREPIDKVLVLQGEGLDKARVKKMLAEMGFNVRIVVGNRHHADLVAIMRIKSFKKRLHLRLFLSVDKKKWMITLHTDWNWMNLNLFKPIKSHLMKGMGDYKTGTLMAHRLFKLFFQRLADNKSVSYDEIVKVTRKN